MVSLVEVESDSSDMFGRNNLPGFLENVKRRKWSFKDRNSNAQCGGGV
jgi:hypothetical protein